MAADEPEDGSGRPAGTDQLWADVRIDPVEIALPGGVGYTLRAYRAPADVGPTDDDDGERELDDFDAAAAAVLRRRRQESPALGETDDEPAGDEDQDEDDAQRAAGDENEDDDEGDELEDDELEDEYAEEAAQEAAAAEDVPVFLGRGGRLYLFHSPQKLVEFVTSADEHDLSGLDTWPDLVRRIRVADVDARDEDTYELDLVVENLRGGADAWDTTLLLKAGELARDLGYALRLETVLAALGSGSPLDDLDEALRAVDAGGVGGFFARRKLRKMPIQQTWLAWRTVIGKIAGAADWRDS